MRPIYISLQDSFKLGLVFCMTFSGLSSGCSAKTCRGGSNADDEWSEYGDGDGDGDGDIQVGNSPGDGDLSFGYDTSFDAAGVQTHIPVGETAGVDESDLVQVQGQRLYVHSRCTGLNVLDMANPSYPVVIGNNAEVAGKAGELYVRDEHALVVVAESSCDLPGELGGWFVVDRHQVAAVDTSDSFSTLGAACLPGHVVSSRAIEDRLYVLSVYAPAAGPALSWLIVLDIADPSAHRVIDVESFSGVAHEFHVTASSIAVAEKILQGDTSLPAEESLPTEGMGMGGAGADLGMGGDLSWTPDEGPKAPPHPASASETLDTNMRYFTMDADSGKLRARGQARLYGAPQGRFHYDIHGDFLRVVTFEGRELGSNVFVVDLQDPDHLEIVGGYYGLAPGEDLHAALFAGDRLYVVTYEAVIIRTDPLWVFDLQSPEPELMAHLEVPGFSSHLYPLSGDTLLAIGRGDEGAGVAASLFDVSQITAPVEVSRVELGDVEAFTEGNLDFRGVNLHALGQGPRLLTLPLTVQQEIGGGCTQSSSLEFIDVTETSLTHRSTVPLPDRPRRTLALDSNVISVGDVHVTTYDVADRAVPFVRSTVTVGDPDAPIECIDFQEVLGNSPDALEGGDGWWEGDDSEWSGDYGGVEYHDDDDGCD